MPVIQANLSVGMAVLKQTYGVPEGYWAAEEIALARHTQHLADGCWEWGGSRPPGNSGQVANPQRKDHPRNVRPLHWMVAHRVSELPKQWQLQVQCGNLMCVNPAHMCLTPRAPSVPLSTTDKERIRELHAQGAEIKGLAERFGIAVTTAWRVVHKAHGRGFRVGGSCAND